MHRLRQIPQHTSLQGSSQADWLCWGFHGNNTRLMGCQGDGVLLLRLHKMGPHTRPLSWKYVNNTFLSLHGNNTQALGRLFPKYRLPTLHAQQECPGRWATGPVSWELGPCHCLCRGRARQGLFPLWDPLSVPGSLTILLLEAFGWSSLCLSSWECQVEGLG